MTTKILMAAVMATLLTPSSDLVAQGGVKVFSQPSGERTSTRILYWGANGPEGQVCISFGNLTWKASHGQAFNSPKIVGKRWRLGTDFWTTLDTQLPLTVGGKSLKAGLHYLTVAKTAEGKIQLHVLDPVEVRQKKLDPFVADKAEKAVVIDLEHKEVDKAAEKLAITLTKGDKDVNKLGLRIAFGPHELSVPVEVQRKSAGS